MIRERRLGSLTYGGAGAVNTFEMSKDAVYHQVQIEIDGNLSITYPSGTAQVNSQLAEGFPFNLIQRIRLIRNGSDVIWAGSGKQLAKESLILNGTFPFARIWVDGTNNGGGTANALLTKSVRGITIPSNSEGIGCNNAVFTDTAASGTVNQIDFRAVLELWLQLPVDKYFTTLVESRSLSSFQLEVTWEQTSNFIILGSNSGGAATLVTTINCAIMSYDQDNLAPGLAFGTFKRSSLTPPGVAYSSSGQQFLLPKGNLYFGVLIEALGLKSAGLATIPQPGNDIITEIVNRVNTNYYLRDVFFRDLQAKNRNDGALSSSPYDTLGAGVLGWAAIKYPITGDKLKELVQTFSYDTFDLLFSLNATTGGGDGNTYNGSPTINILTQEVIPGRSVAAGSPRGAYAGSIAATSAKPGM